MLPPLRVKALGQAGGVVLYDPHPEPAGPTARSSAARSLDRHEVGVPSMLRRIVPLVGYIATIFLANLSLQYVGWCAPGGPCLVPVWPGIWAPSGVLWAGLAFTLRDLVQDELGRVWTVVAIVVGALLSALVSPQFAVASGVAFLLSELADFAVYTPIRQRNWLAAVALSNTVGLVADSVLFLQLAFGSLDFLAGQVVGKLWMTVLGIALVWFWRRRVVASAVGSG